jgi:Carboxypeptidase regulatory-like domain/TonB-dependent Receptor Plug Domain/TonB dependent receptor
MILKSYGSREACWKKNWSAISRLALLLLSILGISASANAQFDSGAVLGNIKDPSGATIASATVELVSVATSAKVASQTDTTGGYEFDSVQPGEYTISVTAPGFEVSKTDVFRVNVGARQRVDLTLKLGAISDTVTVSGAAALLETDTSDRGETVQGAEAVALPLNGRSYADLAQLVPGVRRSLIATVASNPPRDASYNVNGLTSMDNNFTLDGIDNNAYQEANQGYSNEAVIPSPDALQEFKVQTDNYSAEYGRAGGAIVNASTRSGTNAFHGGAYDYLRNTDLNAFGPFYGTGVKPTLVQNQFGATFGGPVLKDKLFFFMDYEGLRTVAHQLTTATLPTPTELTGLFTSDGTAGGAPVPVKNPYTGVVYANGQVPLTDPNIDPVALETFKYLPAPNIPGAALTAANFQNLPASTTTDDKGDARADFILNSRQNGFFRYSQRAVTFYQPAPFPGPAGGNNNGTLYARTRQIVAGWNWAVNSHSILELRFGQTWTDSGKSPIFLGATNFYTAAGITGVNIPTDPAYTGGLNAQAVTGFTAFGEQTTNPQFNNPTQSNPRVNYTWGKGRHSLKVGYELGLLNQAISDFHPKYGDDIYAGAFSSTAGSTSQAANLTDFLFGARNNYSLNAYNEINYERYWHMGYIQDDWKALPNLTINAGLRYEFVSPNYEQNNELLNYDPVNQRLLHAGTGTDVTSIAPGHIYTLHYVGGSSLADRGLVNPDYHDFGPRLGFSYQPLPKTVLRGGYAISYAYLFRFGGEGMLGYNGPNNYDATINQTPGQGLCVTQAGSTAGSLTLDPSTCFRRTQDGYENNFDGPANFSTLKAQTRYQLKDFKTPYVQSFHLSAQQELPYKFTLEVAYVGDHAVHVPALADSNQARTCLPSEVPAATPGQCTTNLQGRRPVSTFTDILTETNLGFLDYNALQTKLERRFSDGLFLINSFTWSHGINNSSADLEAQNGDGAVVNIANPQGDRGPSGYNQPFNDTTSVIADLPFGHGKRFGANIPEWQQQVLGGWQLTGINIVTSGVPIDLTYSASTNQVISTTSSAYSLRPNLTSTPGAVYGKTLVKTNSSLNGYLTEAGVSIPSGTQLFGNAGRNDLRGPAFGQFDLAAHKRFTLPNDRYSAEFRIEAFNVLNSTNYISPGSSAGSINSNSGAFSASGSFGQFSGSTSVYPSRQVQLALRLAF